MPTCSVPCVGSSGMLAHWTSGPGKTVLRGVCSDRHSAVSPAIEWVKAAPELSNPVHFGNHRSAQTDRNLRGPMDFSFSEEQTLLQDSIEKFIHNDYPFDQRQKIARSEQGFSADKWRTFAELGWLGVPFSEADGGFGGKVYMPTPGRGHGTATCDQPTTAGR